MPVAPKSSLSRPVSPRLEGQNNATSSNMRVFSRETFYFSPRSRLTTPTPPAGKQYWEASTPTPQAANTDMSDADKRPQSQGTNILIPSRPTSAVRRPGTAHATEEINIAQLRPHVTIAKPPTRPTSAATVRGRQEMALGARNEHSTSQPTWIMPQLVPEISQDEVFTKAHFSSGAAKPSSRPTSAVARSISSIGISGAPTPTAAETTSRISKRSSLQIGEDSDLLHNFGLSSERIASTFASIQSSFDLSIKTSSSLVVAVEEALGRLRAATNTGSSDGNNIPFSDRLGGSVAAMLLIRMSHLMQNGCGETMRKLLFMLFGCVYEHPFVKDAKELLNNGTSETFQNNRSASEYFEKKMVPHATSDCSFLVQTPMYMSEYMEQRQKAITATKEKSGMSEAISKAGAIVTRVSDRNAQIIKKLFFNAWRQHVKTFTAREDAWLSLYLKTKTLKRKSEFFFRWRAITCSEAESRIGVTAEHNTELLTHRLEKVTMQCARREEQVTKLTEIKSKLNDKVDRLMTLLEEERVETDKARNRLKMADTELKAFRAHAKDALAILHRQTSRPLGSSVMALSIAASNNDTFYAPLSSVEMGTYVFPSLSTASNLQHSPASLLPSSHAPALAAKWLNTFPLPDRSINPLRGSDHYEGTVHDVVKFVLWWVNQTLSEARMHLEAVEERVLAAIGAIPSGSATRLADTHDANTDAARHLLHASGNEENSWVEDGSSDEDFSFSDSDINSEVDDDVVQNEIEESKNVQPQSLSPPSMSRAPSVFTTKTKSESPKRPAASLSLAAQATLALRRWQREMEACPRSIASLSELAGSRVYQVLVWRLTGHLLGIQDCYIPRVALGRRRKRDNSPLQTSKRLPSPKGKKKDLPLVEAEGDRCRRVLKIAQLFGFDGGIEAQQLASSSKEHDKIHFLFAVRIMQRFSSSIPIAKSPFALLSNTVEGFRALIGNERLFDGTQQRYQQQSQQPPPIVSHGTSTLASALGLSVPFLQLTSSMIKSKSQVNTKDSLFQDLNNVAPTQTTGPTPATALEAQLDAEVASSEALATALSVTKSQLALNEKWACMIQACANYAAGISSIEDRSASHKIDVHEALEESLPDPQTSPQKVAPSFYLKPSPLVGSRAWKRLAIGPELVAEIFGSDPIPQLSTALCFPTDGGNRIYELQNEREAAAIFFANEINSLFKGHRGAVQEASVYFACCSTTEAPQTPIATIDAASFDKLCSNMKFIYVISGIGNTDPNTQLLPGGGTDVASRGTQIPTIPKVRSKETADTFKEEIQSACPQLFKLLCQEYGEDGKGPASYFPAAALPIALVRMFFLWLKCLHVAKGKHLHAPPLPFTNVEKAVVWFRFFWSAIVVGSLPNTQSGHLLSVAQLPDVQNVFRKNKDNLRKIFIESCEGSTRMSLENFIACFVKLLRKLDPQRAQFLFHACRLGHGTTVPSGCGLSYDGYLVALTSIALAVKGHPLDDYATSVEHFLHVGLFPHYRAKLNLVKW